jgi:hypothetical protein
MNEQLFKTYIESNDAFGGPQYYKKIEFYPVKIKDGKYLELFSKLMLYPKNWGADKQIFKTSYIKYMILSRGSSIEIENAQREFENFLSYVSNKKVKIDLLRKDKKEITLEDFFVNLYFDDIEITEWEFEEIREIILEQNGYSIEYVNQFHPELEEMISKLRNKNSLSFADQIFTMTVILHIPPIQLGEFTLLQLQNIFDKMITLKQFDLYQPLLTAGTIKLKTGEIKSYLYHNGKRGRYDEILIPTEEYIKKNNDIFGGKLGRK